MEMINQAFGEWDAPVTDDAEWIDTPVGNECLWCREEIKEGDNGRIYGGSKIDIGPDGRGLVAEPHIWTEHRECSLRNVMGGIGHLVDHDRYCHDIGPDAGLTRRQSSLLVWEWFEETRMDPTASQKILWKERLEIETKLHAEDR